MTTLDEQPARPVAGHGTTARVEDAMSRDLVTAPADLSVGSAVDIVLRRGHTHVVVVDDVGFFVDVVPARVLTTAVLTRLLSRHQPIADVVVPTPVSIAPQADLADAAELMLERMVDAVGAVDDCGRLVGLLTWPDIGRAVAATPRSGTGT